MPNINDALETFLDSKALFEGWKKEFNARWYEPVLKMMREMAVDSARKNPNIDQNKLNAMLSEKGRSRLRGE